MILQAELPTYLFKLHQTEPTKGWEQELKDRGSESPTEEHYA